MYTCFHRESAEARLFRRNEFLSPVAHSVLRSDNLVFGKVPQFCVKWGAWENWGAGISLNCESATSCN